MSENNVINVEFGSYLNQSYLNYAKDVILARALPDVADGLKPVQRRILYYMYKFGLHPSSPFKKSARTVGGVLGFYHPHGDASVYEALVNMCQEWKRRCPQIDMHGNNGSAYGDPAAAMRYTESKLSPVGELMMQDIDKETVEMVPNYDESEMEPKVLPSLFPNLLINGTFGTAVGVACSFAPHNPVEIFAAIDKCLEHMINGTSKNIGADVASIIKGPDFPTGGVVTNINDVRKAYATGHGSIKIRSKYAVEDRKGGGCNIVVTETPYNVNVENLIKAIDEERVSKAQPDINRVIDETDRSGTRIVIELKRNANPDVVINHLLKHTPLQASYTINHAAIVDGKLEENLSLSKLLSCYIKHAVQVTAKRVKFDLTEARKRMNIVAGILLALKDIEKVIETIRTAENADAAISALMKDFKMNEVQAKAVMAMKLGSLAKLNAQAYVDEAQTLGDKIKALVTILSSKQNLFAETRRSIALVAKKFEKQKRLTEITQASGEIADRDLIKDEDIVMLYTHNGMVKAMKSSDYNSQSRGGVGTCIKLREDDFVEKVISMSNKDNLLLISSKGKAYLVPAYRIPIVSKAAAGKYLNNYVEFEENETLVKLLAIGYEDTSRNLMFCSRKGYTKQLELEGLTIRRNGIKVVKIDEDDELVSVVLVEPDTQVMFTTHDGFAYRTSTDNIPVQGRAGRGSTGMRFKSENDYVVSVTNVKEDDTVLVVSESGIGKRMAVDTVRESNRGSKGIQINKKNPVCAVLTVAEDKDIIIVTSDNMVIRTPAASVSEQSRTSQGVKLVKLNEGAKIATVTAAPAMEEESKEEEVA